jgi:hypothetical protein
MSTVVTPPPTLTLESADLSLSDHRLLREGKDVSTIVLDPPAAEAAKPTTETADEPGSLETNLEETPAKKKSNLEARFTELTGKIRSLEGQLAAKPGAVTETKPAVVVAPVLAPDPADPEPAADKFTDYVDWQKAWNRWDRRQETRQAAATAEVAQRSTAAKAKHTEWVGRVTTATADYSDFDAVAMNPALDVSPVMGDAIRDAELGPQILYRLGENPAEALRISKLTALSQVREIGKIEAVLTAERAAAAADETLPKAITVSKAPAPHKPSAAAAAGSAGSKNIDTMSQAEYRAYRESGKIR